MAVYATIGSEEGLEAQFDSINTALGQTVFYIENNTIKVNYGVIVSGSDIIFTLDRAMFIERLSIEIPAVNTPSFFIRCKANGKNTSNNRYFIGITKGSNTSAVYSEEISALLPVSITLLPMFLESYLQ